MNPVTTAAYKWVPHQCWTLSVSHWASQSMQPSCRYLCQLVVPLQV